MKYADTAFKTVLTLSVVVFGAGAPQENRPQAQAAPTTVLSWLLESPPANPGARAYHGMAFDSARGRTVIFGGQNAGHVTLGDTWEWDGAAWTSMTATTSPSARLFPAMAYDSARGKVVLFGGNGSSGLLGDTWEWDGTDWVQKTPLTGPPARFGHTLGYDNSRGRVVLFGGYGSSGILADTWEWDGTDWVDKTPATGPVARYHHACAYDAQRQRVVVFGGFDGFDVRADTWEWDGAAWVERASAINPSARYAPAMTGDSQRGRIVLFGGYDGSILGDTWEWDGSAWTETMPSGGPSNRLHAAMTYDSTRGRVVLYGGAGTSLLAGDTWRYFGHCGANADCDDGNPCTLDVCANAGTPGAACSYQNVDGSCSDGNPCTQSDTCRAGVCVGGDPVVCSASDACHDAGSCDPATGACSNPAKADGTSCNDGNACTQTDRCQAGVCTDMNPVVCVALDQCHAAGICNPASGSCSNPSMAEGSPCNDGNACTQGDTCRAGSCVAGAPVDCSTEVAFVSNYAANTITVYPRNSDGDVSPMRTIRTGLNQPHTLGLDFLHNDLFVANNLTDAQGASVNVYDAGANFPSDAPKRTITGPLTLLNRPAGLAVDSVHQELYVANDITDASFITVFDLSASGNTAPLRVLQGPQTGINGPIGMALDLVHDELFVVNYKVANGGSIAVFPRTASGNTAPLRTVQGPSTGFNNAQSIALDLAHDEMIVSDSFFDTASPGSLVVFPRSASGDTAPVRQVSGPDTGLCNPIGIVLDRVNNEIVAANSHASSAVCDRSVTTFDRSASGDSVPKRRIGPGPNCALNTSESVLVTTRVDCSDPLVADGTPCDDGNACTVDDACSNRACTGAALNCDDGNTCTTDSCDPEAGCRHDGNPDCHPALDCSGARASGGPFWPPNHRMVAVRLGGVTDPAGGSVTYSITGVASDEPVDPSNDGFCPDGAGVGSDTAFVRAERDGSGDGRVYTIAFTAHGNGGGACNGTVTVCVPHDQAHAVCRSQGALYDATGPCPSSPLHRTRSAPGE